MAGAKIALSGVTGELRTDTNDNARVNLPVVATTAGFTQVAYVRDSTTARNWRITEEGENIAASSRLLFSSDFNGTTAGALINTQWNQQATTMTSALNAGFLRFNSGAITTINTGISINTWRTFSIENGGALSASTIIKHLNGNSSNKVVEYGYGYYDVAANQNAATNEFFGFRWTAAGNLVGVVEYSNGGAPTTLTVNINAGIPFSDNISRNYQIILTDASIEFWVANIYQAKLDFPVDAPGISKGSGYPIIFREYLAASAPAAAPVFDFGSVSVKHIGNDLNMPFAYRQVGMGRNSGRGQAGLTATAGNTASIPTSGTSPSPLSGTNTASVITGLGGFYGLNGSAFSAVHVNIIISAYQNTVISETLGAPTDSRNKYITDVLIAPVAVSTVLVGGGAIWQWFIAYGGTALSLATADAIGTTAPGTKSHVMIPLSAVDVVTANAAANTIVTRTGDSTFTFNTPLLVAPGEFFIIGCRILTVTAITSGSFTAGIGVNGIWD